MKQLNRLIGLDIFKGIAVIMMVIFHFFFDLNHFNYLNIDFFSTFWKGFRYFIVTFFLFSVGISLVLSHTKTIHFNKVIKRTIVLGAAALLVSLVTYYLFTDSWIYFGILHFIWLTSLLTLPFLFNARLAAILALIIIVISFFNLTDGISFFTRTLPFLPKYTQDFVPIFPWMAVVLLGVMAARLDWHQVIFNQKIWLHKTKLHQFLALLGRYALLIYLIHQVILFTGFYLVTLFLTSI